MRWRSLPDALVLAVPASPLGLETQQWGKTYRSGVMSPGTAPLTPRKR
jgi:hypothetical protein